MAVSRTRTAVYDDEVTSWLRRKKLDERAFLLRRREIVLALVARFADPDPAG
jgi:hypothetical protein